MIAIIDYGMGNIHSVKKALEVMGAKTRVTNRPEEIAECTKLVLPGVGAFGDAMKELGRQGLISFLQEQVMKKKVLLGICLGMQLLFEQSDESKGVPGLGLLPGAVRRFPESRDIKVPHMGWNQLKKKSKECPLLAGVKEGSYVYFCHSYYVAAGDEQVTAAQTEYGTDFASLVWRGTLFGAQFHPEKSQGVGLRIMKNFVEM